MKKTKNNEEMKKGNEPGDTGGLRPPAADGRS
jgi:hypothetical protein